MDYAAIGECAEIQISNSVGRCEFTECCGSLKQGLYENERYFLYNYAYLCNEIIMGVSFRRDFTKSSTMKKNLLLIGWLCLWVVVANAQAFVVSSQTDGESTRVDLSLNDYQLINKIFQGKTYTTLDMDHHIVIETKGFAQLPVVMRMLSIASTGGVDVKVMDSRYTDIQLTYPMLPGRGVIYRNQNPDSIPYQIAVESITNSWYPEQVAQLDEPFLLRDERGVHVVFHPVQYNAELNVLRVYSYIRVEVQPDGKPSVNELSGNEYSKVVLPGLNRQLFINYQNTKEDLTLGEHGDLLLIYTQRDSLAIQPYAHWKNQDGFNVEQMMVDRGAYVVDSVKNAYERNHNLLFVQLVGDFQDVRTDTLYQAMYSHYAACDPKLGCVSGSDVIPDLIVGRFSVDTPEQVTNQLNKTFKYVQQPETEGEWYGKALGLASAEYNTGDDNERDAEHMDVIKDNKLMPGYNYTVASAYDPGATSGQVAQNVDEGLGMINYVGHGDWNMFVTSGFNNNGVDNLTNGDKLPFIVSVACVNGFFNNRNASKECFAEHWLRKEDGGAVATLMASIYQPWTPPMRGQDYFNDILIGGYDYSANPGNGTSTAELRTTFGGIAFNAFALMLAENNGSNDVETVHTWNIFGDASLQVRTQAPMQLNINQYDIDAANDFSAVVSSADVPLAGARVTLQGQDTIITSLTDNEGMVTMPHHFVASDDSVYVTVTAFNHTFIQHKVRVGGGVGVASYDAASIQAKLYPNPAAEHAVMQYVAHKGDESYVVICDVTGRELTRQVNIAVHDGMQSFTLPISRLKTGVYLISVEVEGLSQTLKLVRK